MTVVSLIRSRLYVPMCAHLETPKVQKPFEKEPDFVPVANKSRAPARAMTEPILEQNLPRIEEDLA